MREKTDGRRSPKGKARQGEEGKHGGEIGEETNLSDDLGRKAVVRNGGGVSFVPRQIVAALGRLEVSAHARGRRSGRGHGGRGRSARAGHHAAKLG